MSDLILGIETSCDETAAAVVADGLAVRSSVVRSQVSEHAPYGGVVPEVAARAHDRNLQPVIDKALADAGIVDPAAELAAIAVTNGPGLIGSLLCGLTAAKTLAWIWGLPLVAVDHLRGHIHSARMAAAAAGDGDAPGEPMPDDFIALVVSGGHTALYDVTGRGADAQVTRIGKTRDDAAGEAFDKVAALLDLPYPGGPSVQRAGADGNPRAVDFPRSLLGDGSLDFSFSGLKTSVLYYLRGQDGSGRPTDRRRRKAAAGSEPASTPDICASFEQAVADVLVAKSLQACDRHGRSAVAVVGGVAANARLRSEMTRRAADAGIRVVVPPLRLCTDNAAFIAGEAHAAFAAGRLAEPTVGAYPRDRGH
jgi:N6-L-threonylcarbamoyladenine synthase